MDEVKMEIMSVFKVLGFMTIVVLVFMGVAVEHNKGFEQGYKAGFVDGLIRNYSGDMQPTADSVLIPEIERILKPVKTKGC